jgi:hypothetical protein
MIIVFSFSEWMPREFALPDYLSYSLLTHLGLSKVPPPLPQLTYETQL